MIKTSFKNKIFNVSHFDKKINGIQYKETSDFIEYRVDVFRSVPLFFFKDKSNNLILFDDMEYFNQNKTFKKEIDPVGFWEIMLFGTSLWTRTLYKELIQLPSASFIKINKKNNNYILDRYWNFSLKKDLNIKNIDDAAEKLNKQLNLITQKLDKKQKYTIGLSGGLDSRITLAYLSKYLSKENIDLFTFGYSKNSMEYIYSKKIAQLLNFKKPYFHKLTSKSYKNAINYLPLKSGGQISIDHCHIIDYLINSPIGDNVYVSTYFSDAIFGWDCESDLSIEEKLFDPFLEKLSKINYIEKEIKEQIIQDSKYITNGYDINSNLSSLREYIYISERNQKFHNYLFNIQTQFTKNSICIFHDFDLLKLSLTIPPEFKNLKKIEYYILEKYFNKISTNSIGDISSNYLYRPKVKYYSLIEHLKFKLFNRINSTLRLLTKGYFQFANKYQTEELERVLYSSFKQELQRCYDYLYKKGIFKKNHSQFKRLPIRSKGTSQRYAIISVVNYIKSLQ